MKAVCCCHAYGGLEATSKILQITQQSGAPGTWGPSAVQRQPHFRCHKASEDTVYFPQNWSTALAFGLQWNSEKMKFTQHTGKGLLSLGLWGHSDKQGMAMDLEEPLVK